MEAKTIDGLLARAKRMSPTLCADRERYVAEISFKAGEQQGALKAIDHAVPEAMKAGIKEVVEWFKDNPVVCVSAREAEEFRDKWQAKLKEWGL